MLKIFLFTCVGIVLAYNASAAISLDNYTNSTQLSGTSMNWSHTIVNGTDTAMVVCIGATSTLSSQTVTYGNTLLYNLRNASDGVGKSQLWWTNNLSAGTKTIQINTTSSVAVKASAITYAGVNSTHPIDNHSGNQTSGVASTSHVTYLQTLSANTAVIDCLSTGFVTTHTMGALTNRTIIFSNSTTPDPGLSSSTINLRAPAGIVAMSWTTSAGRRGGITAVSLKEAVYSTDSCTPTSNWVIALEDNCVLSSTASVSTVTISGSSGSFTIASGGDLTCNEFSFTPSDFNGDSTFKVHTGGKWRVST